jgi:hypothetical protein
LPQRILHFVGLLLVTQPVVRLVSQIECLEFHQAFIFGSLLVKLIFFPPGA